MTDINFTTKEEYLAYRAEWKANYRALSKEIRELKAQRKQFKWEYLPKGDTASKRRTNVGDNPIYNSNASWRAGSRGVDARMMLEELADAKIKAGEQMKERLSGGEKAA